MIGEKEAQVLDRLAHHLEYLDQHERVREAQSSWRHSCQNDFLFVRCFGLTREERRELLDWISNQRDFARLSGEGLPDWEANHQAQDNWTLLKSSQRTVKRKVADRMHSITLLPVFGPLQLQTSTD
jgi:hypothetical protein